MDSSNITRLVWLPRDSLKNTVSIMKRLLLLLHTLPLFNLYLQLLLFFIGLCFRWMWKMHFSIVIFSRKSTCNHLLATLILRIKFFIFIVLFMALSKLLGLGLLSSVLWFLSRGSLLVLMIQLSSHARLPLVSLLFSFMWMTWLLQVMIPLAFVTYKSALVNILRWNILVLSATFLILKSHPLLMITSLSGQVCF